MNKIREYQYYLCINKKGSSLIEIIGLADLKIYKSLGYMPIKAADNMDEATGFVIEIISKYLGFYTDFCVIKFREWVIENAQKAVK